MKKVDLISRAAVWNLVGDMAVTVRPGSKLESVIKRFSNAIDSAPAVDAAPVIRCASCKWWNGSTLGSAHRCAALHIATTGEFYCAAAEWKSNAFADQNGAEYADNPTV